MSSENGDNKRYQEYWSFLLNKIEYWDPVLEILTEKQIKNCEVSNRVQKRKFIFDKENFGVNVRALNLFLLFALSILLLTFFTESKTVSLFGIFIVGILFYGYYSSLKKQEKPFAELAVANTFGWLYDSNVSILKWKKLVEKYPEIFEKGNNSQTISGQFWGNFQDKFPFWSANFSYKIVGENSPQINETVYAFKFSQKFASSFILSPQNKVNEIGDRIKSGLTTEWNDFNKFFQIDFNGKILEEGADILEVLSPDIQEKIFEFRREVGPFTMLFIGDVILVSFKKDRKIEYTDFSSKMVLNEKDQENISRRMNLVIDLAGKMFKI